MALGSLTKNESGDLIMNESLVKENAHNKEKIILEPTWSPPVITDINEIPKGDMPGDKIKIDD